jgi:hypothetical protein
MGVLMVVLLAVERDILMVVSSAVEKDDSLALTTAVGLVVHSVASMVAL